MSLDPTWAAAGRLVYVVAPAVVPARAGTPAKTTTTAHSVTGWEPTGAWTTKNVDAWYAAQHLYTCTSAGEACHVVVAAGAGAHDPAPTSHGLLYVDGSSLRYLPTGGRGAVTVAGGLQSPSPYGGFYGYIPWYEDFAWHS
jgi:hypothetical protein